MPLILASIMSKKLAEGLDALVLDVKTGSGAFIQKYSESVRLAKALCATGRAFGVKAQALVTDMSQPLGKFAGNALETYECIKILRGEADALMKQTLELSVELTANMLVQCRIDKTTEKGKLRIENALRSGAALDKFRLVIELQGGDPRVCDRPDILLTKRLVTHSVNCRETGYIDAIDTFAIGSTICGIGGGRMRAEDKIDHAVGFECIKKIGDRVKKGAVVGILHCRTQKQAALISENLTNAYKISKEIPSRHKLIRTAV